MTKKELVEVLKIYSTYTGAKLCSHEGAEYVYFLRADERIEETTFEVSPERAVKEYGIASVITTTHILDIIKSIRRRVRDALNKTGDIQKIFEAAKLFEVRLD